MVIMVVLASINYEGLFQFYSYLASSHSQIKSSAYCLTVSFNFYFKVKILTLFSQVLSKLFVSNFQNHFFSLRFQFRFVLFQLVVKSKVIVEPIYFLGCQHRDLPHDREGFHNPYTLYMRMKLEVRRHGQGIF